MNENQEYDMVRKLAIEIETNIYTINRGQGTIGEKYREKARMILVTLNDSKNQELRSKLLTGVINPRQLTMSNDEDLLNED